MAWSPTAGGSGSDRVRHPELMDTLKRPEEVAGSVFHAHLCLAEYLLYGQQPYAEVIGFAEDLRATAARSAPGPRPRDAADASS